MTLFTKIMEHILNLIDNLTGVKNMVFKSLEKHKCYMTYCIIIHSDRFQFVSKEVTKRELAWNTLISKDRTPL